MKVVILDLGNVLVDYDHRLEMRAVAEISKLSVSEISELISAVNHELALGEMSAAELHHDLVDEAGTTNDFERFLSAFCAGQSRNEAALAYALELQKREGVSVVVISNTNQGHVFWLDQNVPELEQFDLVMMSNEVGLAKPDPDIYNLALDLLELRPYQAIFVDDSATNVDAARLVGFSGIVHSDWRQTRPQLETWLSAAL